MDIQTKAAILRRHETYCYHFIQDEQLSVEAVGEALLEVARDLNFFTDTHNAQKKKVKLAAVRSTLKVKASV